MSFNKDLVLVIDDDHETLRLLKMALERANFQVMTAATWDDVSKHVDAAYRNNQVIDVIVLDLMMPERSGFDVYRALQTRLVSMPPVIMLTAVTGMQQRVDARDLGVTKYLTKPTTPSKLIETIKEVLKESRKDQPKGKAINKFPAKRFDG
jgi:two-component system OmpR family response regulator